MGFLWLFCTEREWPILHYRVTRHSKALLKKRTEINKTKYGSRVAHPKQSPKREAELSERSRESVKLAKIQAIVQNVANVNKVS